MVAVLVTPLLGGVFYAFFLTVLAVLEWVADASLRHASVANVILAVTSALLALGFMLASQSRRAEQLDLLETHETT